MTSPGMQAWLPTLSPDGKKVAFCSFRGGQWQLWEKSLVDGREAPIVADDYTRYLSQWSPDGTRLAYRRLRTLHRREPACGLVQPEPQRRARPGIKHCGEWASTIGPPMVSGFWHL